MSKSSVHLSVSTSCLPLDIVCKETQITDRAFVVLSPDADASQYLYYR